MKRVVLTGTKNSSNTIFSLPEQSAAGGVTIIVHTNNVLHIVPTTPTEGECQLSGTLAILGVAPSAGDALYAFITTDLALGLESTDLTGIQNGTNTMFVVPATVPSTSNLLVFLAGNILEQTTGAPSVGQFRLVAGVITLGLAPTASDVLVAYREVPATAYFRKLSFTLTGNDALVPLGLATAAQPILLVIYTGIRLSQEETSPTTNAYAATMLGSTMRVRLGLPPNADDHVDIYMIGLEDVSDDDVLSPSMLNLRQLERRLLVITNSQIDVTESRMCLDERWRDLQQAGLLSITKSTQRIETRPAKTAGTVAVIQGLDIVRGSGTSFTQSDVGLSIRIDQMYEVAGVDVANQWLFLRTRYVGPSRNSLTYCLFKRFYSIAPDVWRILTMATPNFALTESTQPMLDIIDPNRNVSGEPYRYTYCGSGLGGTEKIELWPVPHQRYVLHYTGLKRSTLTEPGQIIGDLSNLILNGGAAMASAVVANKRAALGKINEAQFWMSQVPMWETKYASLLVNYKRQDRKRFGADQWRPGVWSVGDHPSYDTPQTGIPGAPATAPGGGGFGEGPFGEGPFGGE